MRQSRAMSMTESWANVAAGLGIQTAANFVFIPLLFGVPASVHLVLGFAAIMTVLSVVRSFALRRVFEYLRTRGTPPQFEHIIAEIADERWRQIKAEGYTPARDDRRADGSLAADAATYAFCGSLQTIVRRDNLLLWGVPFQQGVDMHLLQQMWRQPAEAFKPTTPRRDLIKAAAMIVAEIGRLDRLQKDGRSGAIDG